MPDDTRTIKQYREVAVDCLESAGDPQLAELLRQAAVGESIMLWQLIGHTGEYNDLQEWIAATYLNEASAQEHMVEATQWAEDRAIHHSQTRSSPHPWDYWNQLQDNCPWDPRIKIDYTGVWYEVIEFELSLSEAQPREVEDVDVPDDVVPAADRTGIMTFSHTAVLEEPDPSYDDIMGFVEEVARIGRGDSDD